MDFFVFFTKGDVKKLRIARKEEKQQGLRKPFVEYISEYT